MHMNKANFLGWRIFRDSVKHHSLLLLGNGSPLNMAGLKVTHWFVGLTRASLCMKSASLITATSGGENYLRKRTTILEVTYEIEGLTVATPRNRRPLLQGSHRHCLGPLIWESVGEPRYSLNASSDEALLCFWVSRTTVTNRSPDKKFLAKPDGFFSASPF